MKNNKLSGSIIGGILGFVFVITCTSPLVSEENESNDINSENGRYAISTNVTINGNIFYYHEITTDTQTGEVVSRKADSGDRYWLDGLFTQQIN